MFLVSGSSLRKKENRTYRHSYPLVFRFIASVLIEDFLIVSVGVFIQVDVNEDQILMASCKHNIMDPGADSEGMLLSSRE